MTSLTINVPDEFYTELKKAADQLNQTPEQCTLLALDFFFQTDVLENATEGLTRMKDGKAMVDFPELKEELGLEIKFHPDAMEELEALDEEDQIEILEEFINRVTTEEIDEQDNIDLPLHEEGDKQMILSGFGFGDIVYQIGQNIHIYHIALADELEELDDEGELIDEEEFDLEEELLMRNTPDDDNFKLTKSDN